MNWYVIHTKPRQEQRALQNLMQQGFECYLPTLPVEKLQRGVLTVVVEPLFPRYLFIQMNLSESGKSWHSIRSTRGVSHLVTFGAEPAKVDDSLVDALRAQAYAVTAQPQRLFMPGERVQVAAGPFAGIEGVYQMIDGESRAMVLIELISKPVRLGVLPGNLRKLD